MTNKHDKKTGTSGAKQEAPVDPKKQEATDAMSDEACASTVDPSRTDGPSQVPPGDATQVRPSPTKQTPPDPIGGTPAEEEAKPTRADGQVLDVMLGLYSLVQRDMAALAQRLDEVEMALCHVANRTYAPSHPRVRDALSCVRSRAETCMSEVVRAPETSSSVPVTGPPTLPPTPAREPDAFARTRELGERVLAAAARARGRRDEADRLASGHASEEEITEAIRVADEAEAEAFATAEEATAELTG